MKRFTVPSLVLLTLILAVFLRTYHIDRLPPGLYPDEAMNGSNAFEALSTAPPAGGYKLYYPENNGREGLFMNIQAQFLRVLVPWNNGEPEPWMLRIVSAIFGSLTVLGMYFLGKELWSRRLGLFSMFLLATSYWHINFSRIGFRAIMAPFCLVWGLALFLWAVRKGQEKIGVAALISLLGGLVYGLGFHTYIAFRVTPLALLVLIPFLFRKANFWKIAAVFILGTFLAGLPIGLYYLHNPADFFGRTTQVSVFSSPYMIRDLSLNIIKTLGMFVAVGDFNARHNLPGWPELMPLVGLAFIIGIWLAVRMLFRKPDQEETPLLSGRGIAWLIFALLGSAALPVVISNEGLPHALRSILMLPPAILLAALGASWIYDRLQARFSTRGVSITMLGAAIVITGFTFLQYFYFFANDPATPGSFSADLVAMGRSIRDIHKNDPKNTTFVVVEPRGADVRGVPIAAQTVMYMTDSFTPDKQAEKKIYYVSPKNLNILPPVANSSIFFIR